MRGGYAGGYVPLGQRVVGEGRDARLVPDPEWLPVVDRVHELRAQEPTLQRIADRLNAEQVPTPRGGRWYPTSVRRVLRRQD